MENTKVNSIIKELKEQGLTWQEVADKVNDIFNINLSADACRKRKLNIIETSNVEQTTTFGDGTRERTFNSKESFNYLTNEEKLKKLGENPKEMELVWYQEKKWDAQTKYGVEEFYSIGYRVKPLKKEKTPENVVEIAKEVFKENVKPLKLDIPKEIKTLNKDKLLEIPAIELHLGKLGWADEVGQNYDQQIARNRFKEIVQEIYIEQKIQRCDTAVMYIGNDFFNSDTIGNTTTAGTQMQNDVRWQKMFLVGLKLYTEALLLLRKEFNNIEVRLVQGNHDRMSSFYLYIALQQAFIQDNKINFSDNIKETQCFIWGKCAIFTNHGDMNLKRLIRSIPAEFPKEWGNTIFRELHLGHLHKEIVVDDEFGLITRRVASPSGTDYWHYHERFLGATQKHQLFVWHKEQGLLNTRYITFSESENEIGKTTRK